MTMMIVILVVSAALMLGAVWGLYGRLGPQTEGFLIALAGGALIISVVMELIEPAISTSSLWIALAGAGTGALLFTGLDYLVDEKWGAEKGGGLLVAITLDGIPENLALGVALIGAGPMEVMALAGAIFLSNLPEAAGGARGMREDGLPGGAVLALWGGAALLLAVAAIIGNLALTSAPDEALAVIRCIAAGAVVASLATEVFPKAYREDHHMTGIATAIGLCLALWLSSLAGQ